MLTDPDRARSRMVAGCAGRGDGHHRHGRLLVETGTAALGERRRSFEREENEHANGRPGHDRASHFPSPSHAPSRLTRATGGRRCCAKCSAPRLAILSDDRGAALIWNNGGGGKAWLRRADIRASSRLRRADMRGFVREGGRPRGYHPGMVASARAGVVSCSASGCSAGAGRGVPTAVPTNRVIRFRASTDSGKNSSG